MNDTENKWIYSTEGRRWIYRVVTALLAVAAIYLGIDAVQQEAWLQLAAAILNISGAGATALADRNTR